MMQTRFKSHGLLHSFLPHAKIGLKATAILRLLVTGVLFFSVTAVALADRVDDLLKMLQSKTPMDRREAAHELGRAKDSRAVSPLIAALKDEEPMVRLDVSGALIEIGEPVVDPLIQAMKLDNDSIFLWNAIRVLEEVGDPKAIEPLKEIEQKHPDPSIQQISKYALEKLQRTQKP
ncbi:MAG TPA: HEAT repeat domain-containing protein [Nitrospiria bacterium]|nr:HEAT repeat domain-containing protein [Nitrospiria bacterium]